MLIKLSDIKQKLTEKIDVFICSASFEDRCLSIPKEVSQLDTHSKIVFYITDLDEKISNNAIKLQSILGDNSDKIDIQFDKPSEMLKKMSKTLNAVMVNDKPQNFLIDITTFTHEGLLILFRLFQLKIKENDKLFFCYNGAKEYSYNESNPEQKWLSKGVRSVRSIMGYPGFFDPSKKNHLVVLFGFERERTRKLIEIFEYDFVSIAFGSKGASITHEHQILNEERYEELFDFYPNMKKFEISLIDFNITKTQILSHLNNLRDCNTVIAPMNNKISSIGAGLAAIEKPEIQLCYLTANLYNYDYYSIPSDDCYLFEVTLNWCRLDGLLPESKFDKN